MTMKTQLKDNEIHYNGKLYSVFLQDSHRKTADIASIYEEGKTEPIISTVFGKMASFKHQIMPWAQNALKRHFQSN